MAAKDAQGPLRREDDAEKVGHMMVQMVKEQRAESESRKDQDITMKELQRAVQKEARRSEAEKKRQEDDSKDVKRKAEEHQQKEAESSETEADEFPGVEAIKAELERREAEDERTKELPEDQRKDKKAGCLVDLLQDQVL